MASDPATVADTDWQTLELTPWVDHWHAVRGTPANREGGLYLPSAPGQKCIVVHRDLDLVEGELEFILRRDPSGPAPDSPVTVSLRLVKDLRWTAIWAVLRPLRLELYRGSAWDLDPPLRQAVALPAGQAAREIWRFVMVGQTLTMHRNGRQVARMTDPSDLAGGLAITADGAGVFVERIRYRPANAAH